MTQGVLPFKFEQENSKTGLTGLAGLVLFLDLFKKISFGRLVEKHLHVRRYSQGWSDKQIVISLVLLNLAGGDCVDDIRILEGDEGFCKLLKKSEMHGLKAKTRKAYAALA